MKIFLFILFILIFFINNLFSQKKPKIKLLPTQCNILNDYIKDTNKVKKDIDLFLYKKLNSLKKIYNIEIISKNQKKQENIFYFLFKMKYDNEQKMDLATLWVKSPITKNFEKVSYDFILTKEGFENSLYSKLNKSGIIYDFMDYFEKNFVPADNFLKPNNNKKNNFYLIWENINFDKNIPKTNQDIIKKIIWNKFCFYQAKYKFNFAKKNPSKNTGDIQLNINIKETGNYYQIEMRTKGNNIVLINSMGEKINFKFDIIKEELQKKEFKEFFTNLDNSFSFFLNVNQQ